MCFQFGDLGDFLISMLQSSLCVLLKLTFFGQTHKIQNLQKDVDIYGKQMYAGLLSHPVYLK
jgi:hypothetical protein